MSARNVSRAWSWRHAITESSLPAMTRHVLLTLSVCMDEAGRSCFPSVEQIGQKTGLGKTAVIKHLQVAVEEGWLRKGEHGYRGRKWRRSEYEASWPGRDIAPPDSEDEEGGSRGEPPMENEVVRAATGGGSRGEPEVVREVNHVIDHSRDHSTTSPDSEREAGAAARGPEPSAQPEPKPKARDVKPPEPKPADDAAFQALLKAYPGIHDPDRSWRAWERLDAEARRRAVERVAAYVALERAEGRKAIFALQNYLAKRIFDQAPDPAAKPAAMTMLSPRTKLWWAWFWLKRQRGERVAFMLDLAKSGTGCALPVRDVPDEAALALFRKVERGQPAFQAWVAALAAEGLLISNDLVSAQWIWTPSELPEAAPPPGPGGGTGRGAATRIAGDGW